MNAGRFSLRFLLLLLGWGVVTTLGAQAAALDSQRWAELREELTYEAPPERTVAPEAPEREIALGPVGKYLLIGALAIGLAVLLYFVLRDYWRKRRLPAEAPEPAVRPEELDEDQLTLQQTDGLIARAEANGQWNVAIRLHFLALLKDLQEQARITWRRDKTNRDYRYELAGAPDAAAFAELTTAYEAAWYGDHALSELRYRQLASAFLQFRRNARSYDLTARP